MRLTPTEQDRLVISTAATHARLALERGLQLSAPEAIALICDEIHWAVRAGCSYDQAVALGFSVLRPEQVLPGVSGLLDEIRVEPLFDEGARLVIVRWPLGRPDGGTAPAGAVLVHPRDVPVPSGQRRALTILNSSERVVRVSSHYPLHLVNPRLRFDRDAARGFRLDLPAGDSVRWGPQQQRTVQLVAILAPTVGESER
ncbi:MAG: urease subunit gamma [Actinomycetota bacterium]|nr:urease subunit gamma [Actinomycetota bacterium]